MDCAVIPLRKHGLSLIQSVDFFYPLIDDPYMMGKIALANVVSDLYAIGCTNLDKITLILSVPNEFTDLERSIVVPKLISGFQDAAKVAMGSTAFRLNIQSIATNPWCIIGGVGTAVCRRDEIIVPTGAEPNDVLVLTKPLGTQLATNSYIWMLENHENWLRLEIAGITKAMIFDSYKQAIGSMGRLNLIAAQLMHTHRAHAATDVTGFGLQGHAENLLQFQRNKSIKFEIDSLPIIQNVRSIAVALNNQKLLTGKAVETSGGLLISMSAADAVNFCADYKRLSGGCAAWIIGKVLPIVQSSEGRAVVLNDKINFIDVIE